VIDSLFLVLPWLGTNITLIPVVLGVSVWLLVRRKRPDLATHLVIVQLGSFTLNFLLKGIFDRPRPDLFEPRGQYAWAAYPSGHAIASVSVLLTIAMNAPLQPLLATLPRRALAHGHHRWRAGGTRVAGGDVCGVSRSRSSEKHTEC
jgi:membrane-associated phospholipid phosphatase